MPPRRRYTSVRSAVAHRARHLDLLALGLADLARDDRVAAAGTLRTLWSRCAVRPVRAVGAVCAVGPVCASRPLRALRTLLTLRSLCAIRPVRAVGPVCASRPLRPLRTLRS